MPKVSVIIPTFNYGHFIAEAIESVLAQTYQDFEIIIIDDGSTDNTRQIVNNYINAQTCKPDNTRITIKYFYQENKGLPGARNTGISASKGKYIALLDSDDAWLPEKLDLQVKLLDKYSNIGLVYSNYYFYDGKDIELKKIRSITTNVFKKLLLYNFIPCPTVIFRKECVDKIGSFDESLSGLGSEDWDMWLRMVKIYGIAHIDVPLAKYRLHPNSMIRDLKKMLKSQLLVINKIFPNDVAINNKDTQLKNRAISNIYCRIGKIYYGKYDLKLAKRYLVNSLKYNFFRFDAYNCFFKCMLGKVILKKIKFFRYFLIKNFRKDPLKNINFFEGGLL